jgi:hypothetical protein
MVLYTPLEVSLKLNIRHGPKRFRGCERFEELLKKIKELGFKKAG